MLLNKQTNIKSDQLQFRIKLYQRVKRRRRNRVRAFFFDSYRVHSNWKVINEH